MTSVTYTNLNKLLLIRDIQEIAKTYINDDRSYRWIWKNKIAYVYYIGDVIFMNYISDPDGYEGIAFQRWLADIKAQDDEVPWQRFIYLVLVADVIYIKAILIIPNPTTGSAGSRIFLFIATYSNTQV